MRRIDLRISDARKKLADSIYRKRAIEIDRNYSHVKVNHVTFHMMREREAHQYFEIYAEWMRLKVRARMETYLDSFREEQLTPNDADLSEMSWAFQEVIDQFTISLPEELGSSLKQLGRTQIIEDARRDIDLFGQRMTIEQMRAEAPMPQPPSSVYYNIHIGENRGPIQQGGSRNIQSADRNDHENK
jgi:hypothetical protein